VVLAVSDILTIGFSAGAVVVAGLGAAALNGWNNNRAEKQRRRTAEEMRAEDWARQDRLAAQVKAAADDVAARAELARVALEENQALVAKTAEETHEKLEVIRVDVNSNMTAAMQAELDAYISELSLRVEYVKAAEQRGEKPSRDTMAAITGLEGRIAELRAKLRDRLASSDAAAAAAEDTTTAGGDPAHVARPDAGGDDAG